MRKLRQKNLLKVIAKERGLKLYEPFELVSCRKRDRKYIYRFTSECLERSKGSSYSPVYESRILVQIIKGNYKVHSLRWCYMNGFVHLSCGVRIEWSCSRRDFK